MASQPLTPAALRALMHDHPDVVRITTPPSFMQENDDSVKDVGDPIPMVTSVSIDLFSAMDADPDFSKELLTSSEYDVEDVFRKALSNHPLVNVANGGGIRVTMDNVPSPPFQYWKTATHVLKIPSAVLVSKSAPVDYVRGAKFICPSPGCPYNSGSQDLFLIDTGDDEDGTSPCRQCGCRKVEDVRRRVMSRCVSAAFWVSGAAIGKVLGDTGRCPSTSEMIRVLVRDFDDTDKLCLGENYEMVVVRVNPNDNTFRSLSLSRLPTITSRRSRITARSDESARLPPPVADAFKRFSSSPWNFVRWLSLHFCPDAAPIGALTALKEGLLLSLASCGSKASKLGVLVATDDPGVVMRLYREAFSLFDTSVEHLNCGTGLRHLTTGKFAIGSRGVAGVEAGSLLLANGGICCLGDIDSYSKVDLERLKSTLEMKQVSYERPRSQSRRKKESAETAFDRQPLHCAVWAVMSLAGNGATGSAGRKRKHCEDIGAEGERRVITNTNGFLVDVFGTVFVTNLANDPAARDIELANLLLASTEYDAEKDEVVGRDSWGKFLGEISTRSVSPMKDESSMLLKRYFVASRRVRQQTMSAKGGAEIHVSAIETISAMAESHARLSLHPYVMFSDAVAAVRVFEENLAAQYGYSYLLDPDAHYANATPDDHDDEMTRFYERLSKFIDDYTPDALESSEE